MAVAVLVLVGRYAYRKSEGQKKLDQQKTMQRIREKEVRDSAIKGFNHPDMTPSQKEHEMSEDYMIPVKGVRKDKMRNKVQMNDSIEFGPVVGIADQV